MCRKLHLFLEKSTKTAATRAALLTLICTKSPLGKLTALPKPIAVFTGLTSKERERRKGEDRGRGEHGRGEERRGRREFVLWPEIIYIATPI